MEDIIKRRNPNSIPALIYAASAVPGENKVYESLDSDKNKPVNAFLEKRIKSLEEELETNDQENSRKVRAIEQRYTAMTLRYEERVRQLETQLAEYSLKFQSDKNAADLETEFSRQRSEYEGLIDNLKIKLKEKQNELTMARAELNEERRRPSKPLDLRKESSRLKLKLKNQEDEITELKKTVNLLRRERESLLSELSKKNNSDGSVNNIVVATDCRKFSNQSTSPLVAREAMEKSSEIQSENTRLRNTIEV